MDSLAQSLGMTHFPLCHKRGAQDSSLSLSHALASNRGAQLCGNVVDVLEPGELGVDHQEVGCARANKLLSKYVVG